MSKKIVLAGFLILFTLCLHHLYSAEVIEEIVAKINDDIITKSEFEKSERSLIAEIYSNFTGEELDRKIKNAKDYLLYNLINEKLLIQKAEQSYDIEKMKDSILKDFRDLRGFKTSEDFKEFLEAVGMTEEQFKQEIFRLEAPHMVLNSLVRSKINVSRKEIEDYYREHLSDFTTPVKVTVKEIVLKASSDNKEEIRRKGEKILERLKEGEDFSKLAKEFSEAGTKENGGLLGTFIKGELAPDLDERAFRMKEGEISDLIETDYGFHIIKIEKRQPERVSPLEEVKFKISEKISQSKYSEEVNKIMTQMWEESSIEVNEKYQHRLHIKH